MIVCHRGGKNCTPCFLLKSTTFILATTPCYNYSYCTMDLTVFSKSIKSMERHTNSLHYISDIHMNMLAMVKDCL